MADPKTPAPSTLVADAETVLENQAKTPAPAAAKTAYLRLINTEEYGPMGGFTDLTDTEFSAVPAGVMAKATEEQLERRRS